MVNVAPPPGVSVTTQSPPWPLVIASTMARPRPDPPTERLPWARSNRRKMRCREAGGIPGPWSRTHRRAPDGVALAADLDGRAGGRVLGGVVGELQPGLQQAVLVADDEAVGVRLDAPGVVGDHRDELADARREAREVDILHRVGVALDGRQQVDVLDQPGHPVELGDADLPRARDVGGVRGIHELEVAAHDRDRRLELVAHVVQQLSLHVDRAFQPVEHRVHRARQVGDVVVALCGQAGREVADRDRIRRRRACGGWARAGGP